LHHFDSYLPASLAGPRTGPLASKALQVLEPLCPLLLGQGGVNAPLIHEMWIDQREIISRKVLVLRAVYVVIEH
jgi:hypothetical protein